MNKARDLQLVFNKQLNDSGISLVTCGNCGLVLMIDNTAEQATCCHCDYVGDISDYPDLFYQGMNWKEQE